jgi:hypothetical protein
LSFFQTAGIIDLYAIWVKLDFLTLFARQAYHPIDGFSLQIEAFGRATMTAVLRYGQNSVLRFDSSHTELTQCQSEATDLTDLPSRRFCRTTRW